MSDGDLVWALDALGLPSTSAVEVLPGSMSSAGVHRLQLPGGPAVLKVAHHGEDFGDGPARELDFYLRVAPQLSLRTPRLLQHTSTSSRVALLLSAHRLAQPVLGWSEQTWTLLAQDLAVLHEGPIDALLTKRAGTWVSQSLRRPDHEVLAAFWSGPGEEELVSSLLADAEALLAAIAAVGPCLVHGDCHAGHVLEEDGRLVWIDWQATGVGDPALDLAFFAARAVPEGVNPPLQQVVHAYSRARGVDVGTLARAVLAGELAVLVASWPHFARYNTAEAVDRVHQRVRRLARDWRTSR